MLLYSASPPTEPTNRPTLAILLHGRGSHRGDLQALRPFLPPDWHLITPQAPHPGHPWGYGPGWAWYRYLEGDRVDERSLATSLTALDGLLAAASESLGVQPRRVVLGGFSQGGTTSMVYGLTRPGAVTAVLNFSGFLPRHVPLPMAALATDVPPIFWGHGFRDANIPHLLAAQGRERLAAAGVPVEARDYDLGHWITPEEVADAVDFALGFGE